MEIDKLLNNNLIYCPICFKEFPQKWKLKKHYNGRHGIKYKCFCGKELRNWAVNINRHNKDIHNF